MERRCQKAFTDTLSKALRTGGFQIVPPDPADLRAVRGLCEVQIRIGDSGIEIAIPVVRLGPERPLTAELSKYLEDRNAAGKGPGAFNAENGIIWYQAEQPLPRFSGQDLQALGPEEIGDPAGVPMMGRMSRWADDVVAAAHAMQRTVEKIGPRILNIIR